MTMADCDWGTGDGTTGTGYLERDHTFENFYHSQAEPPPPPPKPKYDPGRARQMWQPGYPRIKQRGEKIPSLMPRFNQVVVRPYHGRRGAK